MKYYHQLFRHNPEEGKYGDCYRTCIACLLDMKPGEVPHFMNTDNYEEGDSHSQEWLAERGLCRITISYPGSYMLREILNTVHHLNPEKAARYMMTGKGARGVNHTVVCFRDKIEWCPVIGKPKKFKDALVGPAECPNEDLWFVHFIGKLV